MLSIGIFKQPYTVIPTILGSDFGAQSQLWSQNDVIMSQLRLTATSNWFPHPYLTHRKCLGTLICYSQAYVSSCTHYTHPTWLRFGAQGQLWSKNDVILSWMSLKTTSNCFPHPCQNCKKCLSTLVCCPQAYGSSLQLLYPHYLKNVRSQRLTVCRHSVGLSTKNEQEFGLGFESLVKINDPSPLWIPDWQSKMLPWVGLGI